MNIQSVMPFVDNLKHMMEKRGLRAVDLSELTGMPASQISQLFINYRQPGIKVLVRLSKALNCSIEDLIEDIDTARHRGVPVIAHISAGHGIVAESSTQYSTGEGFTYIELPPGISQEQADSEGIYALKVKGDSMKPRLYDGNLLYIRPGRKRDFKNGDLVIFRDSDGSGWVKEIETVNGEHFIFKSIGEGPTIIKRKEEIDVLERVYLIMP